MGTDNVPTLNWGVGACLKKCANRSKGTCEKCINFSQFIPHQKKKEAKDGVS